MASTNEMLRKAVSSNKDATLSSRMDYTDYKYTDIQSEWIIYKGNLNYLYDQFKLFNMSQFTIYYVVLAKIPIEDEKQIMAIYLYRNQKQRPSYFFPLNDYEKVSDQCTKPVKSKYFLFQLFGKGSDNIEIFGTDNVDERDKWIKHINQAIQWTKKSSPSNGSLSNQGQTRRSWIKDVEKTDNVDADVQSNYEPFVENGRSSSLKPNDVFMLPHRPPPPIPIENPANVKQTPSGTQNVYSKTKKIPQLPTEQEEEEATVSSKDARMKNHSTPLEDDIVLTWKDVFYDNAQEDHAQVLNSICQIGAFLVRPQLKKSDNKNHSYTLSIFAFVGIIKYRILKLPNEKYCLVSNNSQPSFSTIPDLCRHYISHQLPHSISRDDLSTAPVGNLCLKMPYTTYLCRSNKF